MLASFDIHLDNGKDNSVLSKRMMGHKERIFIVEDDDLYSMLLESKVKEMGDFVVHRFASGEEMLQTLEPQPTLLILDYYLSGINGLEVLKRFKERCVDVPVIILSGQDNVDTTIKALNAGATEYIVKSEDSIRELEQAILKVQARNGASDDQPGFKLKKQHLLIAGGLLLLIAGLLFFVFEA